MNKETREKIQKHHGYDYCYHNRIHRFCQDCKHEIPAYMRVGDPENIETAVPVAS